MKKAKLTYEITMRYETEVEEHDIDYSIQREIALQTEYLETQGEDLHSALDDSLLVTVQLVDTVISEVQEAVEAVIINGREYPMWNQFVEKKDEFIGRKLVDRDMGMIAETIVTDVILRENGKDSAWFEISGEKFSCGFDVKYGGIGAGSGKGICFHGYGGHEFEVEES